MPGRIEFGRPALRPSLPEAQAAANPQKRRPQRTRAHRRRHPGRPRASPGGAASLTSAPEAPGRFHARHRASHALPNAFPGRSYGGVSTLGSRRTPCARCSVGVDRGGGQSPAPSGNAPTSGRARLAIDAHRCRAWGAKSPSADPCLATQLGAEGPGSSNAEGVPTSSIASTYSQCGRFVSLTLKL